MSFIPFAIIGYSLTAGAIVIDKILLKHSVPNPFVYGFYINLLGLLTLILAFFGANFDSPALLYGSISGIVYVFAFVTMFQALKVGQASVVGPTVGALNPLFTLLILAIFFNATLSQPEFIGFFVVIFGAVLLTFDIWRKGLNLNRQLFWITISGLLWALAYIFLKETFENSNFFGGLVITRAAAGLFVLPWLLIPSFRKQAFHTSVKKPRTSALLFLGQGMGALSGIFINYGVLLANPALVNSLFGIQYLVILIVALLLQKKHGHLLDEKLTKATILQKSIGVMILSYGVYLLSN